MVIVLGRRLRPQRRIGMAAATAAGSGEDLGGRPTGATLGRLAQAGDPPDVDRIPRRRLPLDV